MSDNKTPIELPTDSILVEILPEFIDFWMRDLATTGPEAVAQQNTEEVYRFGHTVKGSFLQFGFRDLAVHGREIMAAANAGEWQTALESMGRLRESVSLLNEQISKGQTRDEG